MSQDCISKELEPHIRGSRYMECESCRTYLNCARMLHHVIRNNSDGSIDKELHVKRCGELAWKFVDEMDLDEAYVYLKGLESFTALVSYAYSQKLVKLRIADKKLLEKTSGDE